MAPNGRLDGDEMRRLVEALVDAFPRRDALAQMVRFGLDEHLDGIVASGALFSAVFELVQWAESRGRVDALIAAARDANPENPKLGALALLIVAPPSATAPVASPPPAAPRTPTRRAIREVLEKILRSDSDLDALCLDFFEGVYRSFTSGMDRGAKLNLLLRDAPPAELVGALRRAHPAAFAAHGSSLEWQQAALPPPAPPATPPPASPAAPLADPAPAELPRHAGQLAVDVAEPQVLDRAMFRLRYPRSWKIGTADVSYDPDRLFIIESAGTSFVTFLIETGATDTRGLVDGVMRDATRTPFARWGAYEGVGFTGKQLDGPPRTIRVFTFRTGEQTFTVIESIYDADRAEAVPGFALIELWFEVKVAR